MYFVVFVYLSATMGRAVHGILFGWDTRGEAGSLTIAYGVTENTKEPLSQNARP